jgi:site-specific DNA recombinase
VEPGEAALVAQLFDWYLEPQATVYRAARRLTDLGVVTPMGKPRWNVASVRGILRNPAYTGRALTNRTRVVPARRRKSAMLPVGPGQSHAPRPEEDWIAVPVPPIVSEQTFAQVQAKLDTNQRTALRNTRHEYLLRAGQLRWMPAVVRCPPDRGWLPLLPVPRPHGRAAGGPGAAVHRPLHPR